MNGFAASFDTDRRTAPPHLENNVLDKLDEDCAKHPDMGIADMLEIERAAIDSGQHMPPPSH
ncbi:MAG: hypothetical protein WDM89_05770 [Rhizomicrobium sp.]